MRCIKIEQVQEVYKPKIITFLCNWCGYAGADFAGVSRYQYPPSIRVIRVLCSGRIQPALILNAFNRGSDGVLICGCHIGDCHYISGNEKAEERVKKTKKLLELLRIDPKRLRLEWISASEGIKFAEVVRKFTNQLIQMGPLENEI
ncbi:MAG: hydrogenase iron-sulfur subunit [Promethearchaeota archaeon]